MASPQPTLTSNPSKKQTALVATPPKERGEEEQAEVVVATDCGQEPAKTLTRMRTDRGGLPSGYSPFLSRMTSTKSSRNSNNLFEKQACKQQFETDPTSALLGAAEGLNYFNMPVFAYGGVEGFATPGGAKEPGPLGGQSPQQHFFSALPVRM